MTRSAYAPTLVERAIATVSPSWAASRYRSRMNILAMQRAYEAAEPGRLRRRIADAGSGNAVVQQGAEQLRAIARHLERNHDLARGVLNVLVRNTIGATGIGIEPAPKANDGTGIHGELAKQIHALWTNWCENPEVSGQWHWRSVQRLVARSWYRDGEVLGQHLSGFVPYLDHRSSVPYSLELIEADLLPFGKNDPSTNLLQGIECNTWGRPTAFHVLKQHPGDPMSTMFADTKRLLASNVFHVKAIDRIGQRRGVSIYASVLTRLDDLKDYEESERIAAKIAASMSAYIKKGSPDDFVAGVDNVSAEGQQLPARALRFQPGMVFDDLRPGEDVGTIDSKRPNPNAETWRNGQLRGVAAGADVSYSSSSKDYNGTYSAQRQELVEQYAAYRILSDEFINQFVRPVYRRFINAALLSETLKIPAGVDPNSVYDATYVPPAMPWIDPLKEATAWQMLEKSGYVSGPEVIRSRGGVPDDVIDQEADWIRRLGDRGITVAAAPTTVTINEAPTP